MISNKASTIVNDESQQSFMFYIFDARDEWKFKLSWKFSLAREFWVWSDKIRIEIANTDILLWFLACLMNLSECLMNVNECSMNVNECSVNVNECSDKYLMNLNECSKNFFYFECSLSFMSVLFSWSFSFKRLIS